MALLDVGQDNREDLPAPPAAAGPSRIVRTLFHLPVLFSPPAALDPRPS